VDFKFRNIIRAERGQPGSGSNKSGRKGRDETLVVPAGTIIKTYPDEKLMFDFDRESIRWVAAQGGKGGRGNSHFKSSRRQAPRTAESGTRGETVKVVMELKLIAFAGMVGLPNAGKSTLLSKLTGARPKIADYPFTTLIPHLGVVYNEYDSLVMADIPGIIENAHRGEGMGLDFLRHIERNELLIYLIDLSADSPSPLETLELLQRELKSYKSSLSRKKFMVAGNKIDSLSGKEEPGIKELEDHCQRQGIGFVRISALKGIHLERFKRRMFGYFYEK
jgi:GTP-binding protein